VENKTEKSLEKNATEGKSLKIQCSECRGKRMHLVLQSIDTSLTEYANEDVYPSGDNYQIIQCQGCETISFRHLHSNYYNYPDVDETEILYPKKRLSKKDFNVQKELKRIYQETIECFNNEVYTLCAAGLRTIIEGICEEQGIKKGPVIEQQKDGSSKTVQKYNLEGKISGLSDKNILTRKEADILHELRLLGNKAAHQLSQPSPKDLTLAIEIIEHMLETLYEIPEKAKELRNRHLS
jgi:hypothetical protein